MKKNIKAAVIAAVMLILSACTEIENDVSEGENALPAGADTVMTDIVDDETTDETLTDTAVTDVSDTDIMTSPVSETEFTEDTSDNAIISINTDYSEELPADENDITDEATDVSETSAIISDGSVWDISLTFYETTLDPGETTIPYVTMSPADAPDKSEIWTSSDEKVATVDWLGNITAVSAGQCTVTVQSAACPEISAQVMVTVTGVTEPTYIDGILVVNKTYALPADYGSGVDPQAQSAFDEMQRAAEAEGLNIYISSGYRSYDYQASLYKRYADSSGTAEADRYSARPGHSEHQTGLAFDLNTIDDSFADTDEYVWVKEHCAEYGFIIRYPEGKEDITGYMYEPWHIRYLGVENAVKVSESGLTLEEYLGIDSKYDD